MTDAQPVSTAPEKPASNPWRTFGIIVITVAVTLGITYWVVTTYLFPSSFTPVTLSKKEQQRLNHKLKKLGIEPATNTLEPEPYTESDASREIFLSEKELNALLANNTDLASRLAIDLSANLASAKLLIDLDPDFPLLGGKTIKVTAGMELSIKNGKPRALLRGVSVWGVPLPNAWLGNMKNINLIDEFGQAGGFWQAIKDGVDEFEIKEGKLRIKLKQ